MPEPVKASTHIYILATLPIIQRLISVYKLWDGYRDNFPKKSRYTLGLKIDSLFLDIIEYLCVAKTLQKPQKLPILLRASGKLDVLKFFLHVAWELKAIETKHYTLISEPLNEIGKMLGGWIRGIQSQTAPSTQTKKETPPVKTEGE